MLLIITYYKGEAKCIRNLFTFLKIFVFNIYLVCLSLVVLFLMLEFFFCYYYLYNCSLLVSLENKKIFCYPPQHVEVPILITFVFMYKYVSI